MQIKHFTAVLLMLFFSCNNDSLPAAAAQHPLPQVFRPATPEHVSDILLPEGYTATSSRETGFSKWLSEVKLKKDKTVYLYNGMPKQNQAAQFAVLDISVGDQNLQQCADAVMRLRAEYLYAQQKFDEISFTDNEGKRYNFTAPYDRSHFSKYLNTVFGMCGSASLSKELLQKQFKDIAAGDVIIRGGFPGHAVIVMETAVNQAGEKIYLLAQSYMPAQDIHILQNPNDETFSPWYKVSDAVNIITPEYYFKSSELKTWKN